MRHEIPAPIIALLAKNLDDFETHAGIDNLFLHADAPGEPPNGNKIVKVQSWLRRINRDSNNPLTQLGKIIEGYMETLPTSKVDEFDALFKAVPVNRVIDRRAHFKASLEQTLEQYNLSYFKGGVVLSSTISPTSKLLSDLISARDMPAIESEFNRALTKSSSEPREAVSAACNILESIFKTYISDEGLGIPAKQDLQSLWKVVRKELKFDPSLVQDDDLKKILSGIFSVVDGVGAFRTHASSAHGEGRKTYKLKPRHARLAVNSAHTLGLFVLETWSEAKI